MLLGISVCLSLLFYKKLNPTLTKITSNENCFTQSKFFGKTSPQSALSIHYYINTFYLFQLLLILLLF